MYRYFIILFYLCFIISKVSAKTYFYDSYNRFAPYSISGYTTINDNNLIFSNQTFNKIFNVAYFDTTDSEYTFEVKIASLNNNEAKSYKYYDRDGKRHRLCNPEYSVVWNYQDSINYRCITVRCNNIYPNDFYDERTLDVEISDCIDGKKNSLFTKRMTSGVNLYSDFNVFSIRVKDGKQNIYLGNRYFLHLAEIDDVNIKGKNGLGLAAGVASKLSIERIVLKTKKSPEIMLQTSWDLSRLSDYMSSITDDPLEGYWCYFDRKLDQEKLMLGGEYKLAIVKSGKGKYDIIYFSGAKTNGKRWKLGMKKGALSSTNFEGNYNLEWYDSMMEPFKKNVYAILINSSLLELHFPIQDSVVRFTRCIK